MQSYNSKLYPEPDKKDAVKMKEFFTLKYKQKRFASKEDSESGESGSDSDSDKKKKKSKKEETKKKKKHNSDDEDSDQEKKKKKHHKKKESSESEEEEMPKAKVGAGMQHGKLMAPPHKKSGLAVPTATHQVK